MSLLEIICYCRRCNASENVRFMMFSLTQLCVTFHCIILLSFYRLKPWKLKPMSCIPPFLFFFLLFTSVYRVDFPIVRLQTICQTAEFDIKVKLYWIILFLKLILLLSKSLYLFTKPSPFNTSNNLTVEIFNKF